MLMRNRAIILLILLATAIGAVAKTTFELQQPTNAVLGRYYRVTYVLRSDDPNALNSVSNPTPEHPAIQGMRLYSGPGVTQGYESTFDSRNGSRTSYTLSLVYTYIPEAEGEVTIPALSINVAGTKYTTRSAKIRVLGNGGGQQSGSASAGSPGRRPQAQVIGSSVGTTTPQDLMVIITFSRSSVYEMEPVVADIKLCLNIDHSFSIENQFNSVTLPEFDGFLSEDLPVSGSGGQIESINGRNYETYVIRRYLLYPQKSGRLRISSGQYEINVIEYETVTRGYYPSRREVPRKMNTATNTVTLDVKPLPEPRPAGFSGAVGQFSVEAAVAPQIVRSNESATYTLTVRGSGNIKYLNAPEIPFPSTFETYTPKTDIDASFSGNNYRGSFVAEYPFVPQEVGKFNIDPFTFIYFDPAKGKYETVTATGFNLNILRGNGPAVVATQKEVDTQMTDILHIHPLPAVPATAPLPIFGSTWYVMTFIVTFIALIAVIIIYRRHVRRAADVAGRRLARAGRVVAKRFKASRSFMKQRRPEQFYDELAKALKGYIGDKLGIPPSNLISDVIAERLTAFGVDDTTVNSVINVLGECEMARFTPSGSDEAMADILARAENAVKAIEDVKVKNN